MTTGTDTEMAVRTEVARILAALESRRSVLARKAFDAMRTEVDRYGSQTRPGFERDVIAHNELNLRTFLRLAGEGRTPSDADLSHIEETVSRRVRQGVNMDDLLHAIRVWHRVVWEAILEEAARNARGPQGALALALPSMQYTDAASTKVAATYLRERQRILADEDRARRDLLENLITGRLPLSEEGQAYALLFRIEPTRDYFVVVATLSEEPSERQADALRLASETLSAQIASTNSVSLIIARHEELVGVVGVADLDPGTLTASVEGANDLLQERHKISIAAGISTICHGLTEIRRGYEEAQRALSMRPVHGDFVALSELSLLDYAITSADETVRHLIPDQLASVLAEDLSKGGELVDTALAYIEADLNVRRAAKALFVHPNTVHYRLSRLADRTGLDVRRFEDLVELLMAVRVLRAESVTGRSVTRGE
jgi:sugar diacid utilization regulator